MKSFVVIVCVCFALVFTKPVTAQVPGAKSIVKAIAKYLAKETGQEATEQAVKKMTREIGEELIERTARKVVREGGEKSLVEMGKLVAKHGPVVVRALNNAPDALPVLKLLDELPADEVAKAASRLAAGGTGKELATLGTKLGTSALRAETKHPGVGIVFAKSLGKDGADLSLRLTSDQAMQIGRHVDDIAKLPTTQQSELLAMISSNADRFSAFVGRFVEKNPGAVLFTAATVPIILKNSDAIFGDGELVRGPDGDILLGPDGIPIRDHRDPIPELGDAAKEPLQTTLYWAGGVIVVLISLLGASKVWKHFQKDSLEVEAARSVAKDLAASQSQDIEANENKASTEQ